MRTPSLLPILATAVLSACGDAPRHHLVVTGSTTVAPSLLEIAERLEAERRGWRVDVQGGGSSQGIEDAIAGRADVGMSSRALTPDEAATLEQRTVAFDGIAIVVHADNPLRSITSGQVEAVYRGAITDWSELGAGEGRIIVANKAEGTGTRAAFERHFDLAGERLRADVLVGSNQQAVKTVAGHAATIGYVSVGTARAEREAGSPIRLLPLDGVEPTPAQIAGRRYPLVRPLLLVTKHPAEPAVASFLEFACSAAGHAAVRAQGLVPMTAE